MVEQCPSTHGALTPEKMVALSRKVGAHRARDPVTKATAVKPRVDKTKLQLNKQKKNKKKGFMFHHGDGSRRTESEPIKLKSQPDVTVPSISTVP